MCLARTCLFLRTKAMSHRSAASSGHRQKTVAGGMNLNEEMEKKRNGASRDLWRVLGKLHLIFLFVLKQLTVQSSE